MSAMIRTICCNFNFVKQTIFVIFFLNAIFLLPCCGDPNVLRTRLPCSLQMITSRYACCTFIATNDNITILPVRNFGESIDRYSISSIFISDNAIIGSWSNKSKSIHRFFILKCSSKLQIEVFDTIQERNDWLIKNEIKLLDFAELPIPPAE